MKVSEFMTPAVAMVAPNDPIVLAAQKMERRDCGALPVASEDRLVGMITDRDIAIRGIGTKRGPDTPVSEVMTTEVMYCYEDAPVEDALDSMADQQVRRMPVLDRDKTLVGILTLSDAAKAMTHTSGAALGLIAEPSALHSQSLQQNTA